MGDIMRQIPFAKIMDRVLVEKEKYNTIYGVSKLYTHNNGKELNVFNHKLENPLGPAAGPHTQLAQNLIASYVGGSRFLELKTVQILDGEDLPISKPCIRADDEAYNVEWSTELYIPQALEEYIKGWFGCKLVAKEYGFGDPDAFIFNMSVGYNLEGIQSKKIDAFIEGLKDASSNDMWKDCEKWALDNLDRFENVDEAFVKSISPEICNSITLSTMHGCPEDEIEKIVSYLLTEKKINTYLKCNPTLLGYDTVRKIMDDMGYDYIKFDKEQFDVDLKFDDAVAMIGRLLKIAEGQGVAFGVKLTNTFQVRIDENELPGDAMYMSGKSLYPLSINVAAKLAKAFDGKLAMSYSGGADAGNIEKIFNTGIWPITVATTLLKPTGYNKVKQLADLVAGCDYHEKQIVDVELVEKLAKESIEDEKYSKSPTVREKGFISFDENKNVRVGCKVVCGSCANVCPNRANIVTIVDGEKKLLHIDDYCNECGNCYLFCPDKCTPYKDRITLFSNKGDFDDSTNQGLLLLDGDKVMYRFEGETKECALADAPKVIVDFAASLKDCHPYLV